MGATRYVPIVFSAEGDAAMRIVQQMTNAFEDLDEKADHAGSNGLRNAFIQADLTSRAIAAGTREVIDAAKEYLQFGRELANLNTLLNDASSITTFRDGLLDLDPALGHTSELARGMYQAISSGVGSDDALDAIEVSAKAARAGLASTFETVDAGTSVMASFGLQGKDLTMIYDKMFEVVKRGKVEMPQLASSIGLVSNLASQAGVSLDEMLAAIATSSRTNRPSIAIEGMRTAISNIIQPSGEAKKLAQELGIEFDASALKAKGFAKFLEDVQTATGGDVDKLSTLFGNVQGLSFIMSITGNQAKTFAEDLKGVAAASGTVEEAFQKQKQSIGAQMDQLKVTAEKGLMRTFMLLEPLLSGILGLVNRYPAAFGAATSIIIGLAAAHALWNTQLFISAIPQLIANLRNIITVMLAFNQVTSLSTQGLVAFGFGWAGVAVAAGLIIYQLSQYETAAERANKITLDQVKAQGQALSQAHDLAKEAELLANAQSLSTEQHERLNAVIGRLDPATQDYIKSLGDEKDQVEAVTKAVRDKVNSEKDVIESHAVTFATAILETTAQIDKQTAAMENARQARLRWRADLAAGTVAQDEANFYIGVFSQNIETAQEKLNTLNPQLVETATKMATNAKAAGWSKDEMLAFYQTSGYTAPQLKILGAAFDLVTAAAQGNTNATNQTTDAINNQTNSVKNLRAELAKLAEKPQAAIDQAVLDVVKQAKDAAEARRMAREQLNQNSNLQGAVRESRRLKETEKAARGVFEPSESRGGRAGGRSARVNEGQQYLQQLKDEYIMLLATTELERTIQTLKTSRFAKVSDALKEEIKQQASLNQFRREDVESQRKLNDLHTQGQEALDQLIKSQLDEIENLRGTNNVYDEMLSKAKELAVKFKVAPDEGAKAYLRFNAILIQVLQTLKSIDAQTIPEEISYLPPGFEDGIDKAKKGIQDLDQDIGAPPPNLMEVRLRQIDALQDRWAQLSDFFDSTITAAMERDWKGLMDSLVSEFKRALSRMIAEWAASKLLKFNPSGNSSGGGGFFSNLLGGVRNLFNIGPGGTAPFNPSTGMSLAGASLPLLQEAGAIPLATTVGSSALAGSLAAHEAGHAAAASAAGGGSSLASLGAFFTNPFTIAAIGAAVAGFALWKHFSHRTEKALRGAIQNEYGVTIKDLQTLGQIKTVGEETFGKGQVRKHLLETIKLEPSKEIIRAYAESTGQSSDKLPLNKEYADPSFRENQFIRRLDGGLLPYRNLGRDYVPLLADGGEYVLNAEATQRNGIRALDDLNEGRAVVVPRPTVQRESGGFVPASSSSQSSSSSGQGNGGIPPALVAAIVGAINNNAQATARLEARLDSMSPGDVLRVAAEANPEAVVDGFNEGISRGHDRDATLTNLGFRN